MSWVLHSISFLGGGAPIAQHGYLDGYDGPESFGAWSYGAGGEGSRSLDRCGLRVWGWACMLWFYHGYIVFEKMNFEVAILQACLGIRVFLLWKLAMHILR